jgi:PAS domain S-box-containing protein
MGHPIQMILARQLAEYLSVPLLLFDPEGALIFFNEPAEAFLGRRFDETGGMTKDEWLAAFARLDEETRPVAPEDLPLVITLSEHRPAHRRLHMRAPDGNGRHVEVSAIPINGLQGEFVGVATFFWELSG